ncbi:hypothetical protein Unana1_01406 [Umbelopsis nana]
MGAHSYAIPRASGRQPSLLTSQPTAIKVIPDVYEIYDTKDFNVNRRLSVNGFEMRPRQLSRSGECVFDPVPTYHGAYGPQAESIAFEASQQYIHEQSRLTSDDTSSTNSSVGDSHVAQPRLLSQPPTPVAGRWRSSTGQADTAICDMHYDKIPYADENSLGQLHVNRTMNTGFYSRSVGSETEPTIPSSTPSPSHRSNCLPSSLLSQSDTIVSNAPKVANIDSRQGPAAGLMSSFSTKASSTVPKRYKCAVCTKRFTRPSSLITHMYSHTGEKPHKCPVPSCGRRFSVVSNLRRHIKIHETEKSH